MLSSRPEVTTCWQGKTPVSAGPHAMSPAAAMTGSAARAGAAASAPATSAARNGARAIDRSSPSRRAESTPSQIPYPRNVKGTGGRRTKVLLCLRFSEADAHSDHQIGHRFDREAAGSDGTKPQHER